MPAETALRPILLLYPLSYGPCGPDGFEPPTNGFEVSADSLPTKVDRRRTPRAVLSGFEPAGFVSPRAGSTKEVTARSLPPKMFSGRNQAKLPWSPFLSVALATGGTLVYCSPRLQTRHGDRLERSIFTFTARKMVEEAGVAPAKVGDRRVYNALPLLLGYFSKKLVPAGRLALPRLTASEAGRSAGSR